MRRKKLYYLPGLISLVGLPILLFFLLPEDKPRQTALRLFLPRDDSSGGEIKFSKYIVYKFAAGKKIIEIDIDNLWPEDLDIYRHHSKMNFIIREMERLQFTNDTGSVLKINLSDENTYGEFVWILNQATIYDFKRFAYVDDCFYLFPNPPPIKYEPLPFLDYQEPLIVNIKPRTKWDIFRYQIKNEAEALWTDIKYNKIISLAFVLLILIPFGVKLLQLKNSRTIH